MAAVHPGPASPMPAARGVRPEIQGLRAIAVALVVGYHLWPHRIVGGFVGVDVFFVISGFLITSHLVREVGDTGALNVPRFWMRRIRRLLPASLLVLACVTVATFVLVPMDRWRQFLEEVAASALYVQNWLLASNSVDYLAASNDPSPVQHYWSLSVEEQFYIVLPLAIALLVLVARLLRRRGGLRGAVLVLIGVVTLASFVFSVVDTRQDAASAYFVSTTRWWEFGVGALIAFAPAIARRGVRVAVSTVGFALIVVSAVVITAATPFPGWIAALPVVGTAAAIWAGRSGLRFELASLVSIRPVRWIGDRSYSIYLWHWPLIVLVPFATGHALGTVDRLVVLVAAIVLATLSTRFVENPVRLARPGSVLRSAKLLIPATVLAMAALVTTSVVSIGSLDASAAQARAAAGQVVASDPTCFGAESVRADGTTCSNPALAGVLLPTPAAAASDDGNELPCWSRSDDSTLQLCSFGPASATVHVLAIGDSHNNSLIPAYKRLADDLGWRVDVAGHAGCYWTDGPQQLATVDQRTACTSWLHAVTTKLAASAPYDAIIVTHRANRGVPAGMTSAQYRAGVVDGLRSVWRTQLDRGVRIIAIRDMPSPTAAAIDCVTRTDASHCDFSRQTALSPFDGQSEAAAGLDGVTVADYTDVFCGARECSPVIGNAVVYQDAKGHLTATFAATLAPRLEATARAAMARPAPPVR